MEKGNLKIKFGNIFEYNVGSGGVGDFFLDFNIEVSSITLQLKLKQEPKWPPGKWAFCRY